MLHTEVAQEFSRLFIRSRHLLINVLYTTEPLTDLAALAQAFYLGDSLEYNITLINHFKNAQSMTHQFKIQF